MSHALCALLLAATLPSRASYGVDAAASSVRYTVVHKLHRVEGSTHQMEARAVVQDDGSVLAMVRVPVSSFRSGDANRDEHMLEAVEAGKFPFVVFKGIVRLGAGREMPTSPVPIDGEVELHGVKRPARATATLTVEPDGSVRARGGLDVSLDAHGVERPSLLFVKIEDDCRVDFDLLLRGNR